jgi:hypothetical protein
MGMLQLIIHIMKRDEKNTEKDVIIIPGYPDYSLVDVGCRVERWESRFSVPHNLFDWKWDWMPVFGSDLYLAEDMLDEIRTDAGLKKDEVIRLREYISNDDERLPALITEYQNMKRPAAAR